MSAFSTKVENADKTENFLFVSAVRSPLSVCPRFPPNLLFRYTKCISVSNLFYNAPVHAQLNYIGRRVGHGRLRTAHANITGWTIGWAALRVSDRYN